MLTISDFPVEILRYISDLTVRSLSPAYVCLDSDGCILEWGGNPQTFGINGLAKGADAVEHLPFLFGLFPLHTDPFVLYGVKVKGQLSTDIHIFKDEDRHWVLLLDANMREIQQFVVQQQLNITALREWRNEKLFSQFLSREVSNKLSDGIPVIETESRIMTILAVELRGSSMLYKNLPLEDAVNSLNTYMVSIIDPILEENGFVDKLSGMSINGIYGFPEKGPDNPRHALMTANKVLANVNMLNSIRKKYNQEPLGLGLGIGTGETGLSIIGNNERKSFTALGTAVEIANELMSLAETNEVLIDEQTFEGLKSFSSSFEKSDIQLRRVIGDYTVYSQSSAGRQT